MEWIGSGVTASRYIVREFNWNSNKPPTRRRCLAALHTRVSVSVSGVQTDVLPATANLSPEGFCLSLDLDKASCQHLRVRSADFRFRYCGDELVGKNFTSETRDLILVSSQLPQDSTSGFKATVTFE